MKAKDLPKGLLKRGDIYHMRFMMKGVLVAESTYTSDLRAAERLLIKKRAELQQDTVFDNKRATTFHAAIDKFIATRATKGAKSNATRALLHFKTIEDKAIKKVEMHEIEDRMTQLREEYALSTISLITTYWNSFVNWCEEQKFHICGKLKRGKRAPGRIRWLTPEEQTALLYQLHPATPYKGKNTQIDGQKQDNYDLTVLLLDTGLRYTEGAELHWNQVDMDKMCLYVTRGKAGRPTTLAMTTRLHDIFFRRIKNKKEYVFPTKVGTANRASIWMKEAAKRAKLSTAQGQITPHVLRHTAASTWLQNGLRLEEVQYLLGHSSIETTQIYAHFVKQDATDKAAEIMNKIADNAVQQKKVPELKLIA